MVLRRERHVSRDTPCRCPAGTSTAAARRQVARNPAASAPAAELLPLAQDVHQRRPWTSTSRLGKSFPMVSAFKDTFLSLPIRDCG